MKVLAKFLWINRTFLLTNHALAVIIQKLSAIAGGIWGYSSAGRALEWHSRGQRFDPAYLHQRSLEIVRFRDFFFCKSRLFRGFLGVFQTCLESPIFADIKTPTTAPTTVSFSTSPVSLFCFGLVDTECIAEFLYCCLANRILDMKVMLRHIQVRMADNALDRRQVNAQRLHLAYVGMSA